MSILRKFKLKGLNINKSLKLKIPFLAGILVLIILALSL